MIEISRLKVSVEKVPILSVEWSNVGSRQDLIDRVTFKKKTKPKTDEKLKHRQTIKTDKNLLSMAKMLSVKMLKNLKLRQKQETNKQLFV